MKYSPFVSVAFFLCFIGCEGRSSDQAVVKKSKTTKVKSKMPVEKSNTGSSPKTVEQKTKLVDKKGTVEKQETVEACRKDLHRLIDRIVDLAGTIDKQRETVALMGEKAQLKPQSGMASLLSLLIQLKTTEASMQHDRANLQKIITTHGFGN